MAQIIAQKKHGKKLEKVLHGLIFGVMIQPCRKRCGYSKNRLAARMIFNNLHDESCGLQGHQVSGGVDRTRRR
jgi:hypothetical protein